MKRLILLDLLLFCACAGTQSRTHNDGRTREQDCDPGGRAAQYGRPNRCDVIEAMTPLIPEIHSCSQTAGVVFVTFLFASDGTAKNVEVTGGGYDEATLVCVRERAGHATLKPFHPETWQIKFPFRLGGQR